MPPSLVELEEKAQTLEKQMDDLLARLSDPLAVEELQTTIRLWSQVRKEIDHQKVGMK